MARSESAGKKVGRARRTGRSKPAELARTGRSPSGKVMAAFRIPRHLHATMTRESRAEGLDLTAYVNRLFDGFLSHFGLPGVVREGLELDREALGFSRHEYLQYVLYRRHEAIAQHGEAFDRGPARRK